MYSLIFVYIYICHFSSGQTDEPLFTPVWFSPKHDVNGNVYHEYLGNYWKSKEQQDWLKCPDIY